MGFPLSGVSMGGFPQSPNYLTSSYCPKDRAICPGVKLPAPLGLVGTGAGGLASAPWPPLISAMAAVAQALQGLYQSRQTLSSESSSVLPHTSGLLPEAGCPCSPASLPAPFSLPSSCLWQIENSHQGLQERNTKLMGTREPH